MFPTIDDLIGCTTHAAEDLMALVHHDLAVAGSFLREALEPELCLARCAMRAALEPIDPIFDIEEASDGGRRVES
ncbi:MAG: hypothetical protein RIB97_01005 [Nitratireductor sp.]